VSIFTGAGLGRFLVAAAKTFKDGYKNTRSNRAITVMIPIFFLFMMFVPFMVACHLCCSRRDSNTRPADRESKTELRMPGRLIQRIKEKIGFVKAAYPFKKILNFWFLWKYDIGFRIIIGPLNLSTSDQPIFTTLGRNEARIKKTMVSFPIEDCISMSCRFIAEMEYLSNLRGSIQYPLSTAHPKGDK